MDCMVSGVKDLQAGKAWKNIQPPCTNPPVGNVLKSPLAFSRLYKEITGCSLA